MLGLVSLHMCMIEKPTRKPVQADSPIGRLRAVVVCSPPQTQRVARELGKRKAQPRGEVLGFRTQVVRFVIQWFVDKTEAKRRAAQTPTERPSAKRLKYGQHQSAPFFWVSIC